ncbi:type I 3-dehydroquinate dehydratase [Brochothrix campestris]|uniref:3-dehydroquinate dehydratase n=1 Tax=Brochothrix campestris FSL F6-1037 TaxID=1265861 RepID=W7D3X3_9LIST|nr:type I 3-dehydroquinate dehydratase [Brochothrix campestris]EUJ39968.1 3-dehydroquinate dehydratase [Brochothrix campestris FSL F6-1037]
MGEQLMLGQVSIKEGTPRRCVSLSGATTAAIAAELKLFKQKKAFVDVLEWRVDCFVEWSNEPLRQEVLTIIKAAIGTTPLIFTCRTRAEGGQATLSTVTYEELLQWASATGSFAAIDIELALLPQLAPGLCSRIRQQGTKVIVSHHNFERTPPVQTMVNLLEAGADAEADITKLAVMPHSKLDVLRLIEASQRYACQRVPVITISMGALGQVSRLIGSFSGSVMTFGALEATSAPGQLEIEQLARQMY